jgi:ADP-heptose:LPS heptosyltransferase
VSRPGDTSTPPAGESVEARPWRGPEPPSRILAIRLQALGDTVLTLPYLQAVRRLLPDATLDFLTRSEVADIPRSVVLFDQVFEIGGGGGRRRQLVGAAALLPRLRARRYQVVLDLQRNAVSRLVRRLLAPAAWSEFDRFSARLAGERTRETIEAVGIGPLEVRPDVVPRPRGRGTALAKLEAAGWDPRCELVVLNPAGAFPGRSWPLDAYARFAERWREREGGTKFLILGLPPLAPRAAYLRDRLGDRLIDLVGHTSAAEAFAILGHAGLVLSEDSGLMHMAWVAGAPTLALFGASRAAWSKPHGNYSDCARACRRPDGACLGGDCLEGSPTCLERLSADEVVERAAELVTRVAGRERVI